jgi:hypothetical protein
MSAAHAADRLDAAVKLLLEGNSPHTVVADIAARYGCGKRHRAERGCQGLPADPSKMLSMSAWIARRW